MFFPLNLSAMDGKGATALCPGLPRELTDVALAASPQPWLGTN